MGQFNFDKEIERRGTHCLKYEFAVERNHPEDALPLWVADMDFQAPPCIAEALEGVLKHGIFGYSEVKEEYTAVVAKWFRDHYDVELKHEWLVKTPGIIFALAMAVRACSKPGDSVIIQTPVYHPFYELVEDNDRKVVDNPLVYENGHYTIDFEDFEQKIIDNDVKVFLICTPSNPICRVWTVEELKKLGEICLRHGVVVVSDDIHCDFAFPGHPYIPFMKACPEMTNMTVMCTAPTKTFNIAGLQISNIFIPDEGIRNAFKKEVAAAGYSQCNLPGLIACQAAYEGGEEWLKEVKDYIIGNMNFLRDYLAAEIPQIKLIESEGTFFAWLDCSGLGLTENELEDLVTNKARLWLDGGSMFGSHSGQFQRIVLCCTRKTLKQALDQLKAAIK